jgi:hypothetical protein
VVCGNDVLAIGAIQEAQSRGIRVPEELSIAGFDDMEIATVVSPALTTVRLPIAEIGIRAAGYLIARLRGEDPPARMALPIELVARASTAAPPVLSLIVLERQRMAQEDQRPGPSPARCGARRAARPRSRRRAASAADVPHLAFKHDAPRPPDGRAGAPAPGSRRTR